MLDVTDATFERDVIVRSKEVAVVVDLWAPWCGPCRTLGPILEKVVAATSGAVELVKVNIDENPQVSSAFQVQSIPAVFGLRDGKVVGAFVGAQPEAAVQQFVDTLLPTGAESEVERLLQAGDEASLRAVLGLEPDRAEAVVALAELLVGVGQAAEAIELLERIPESSATRRVAALARVGEVDGEASEDVTRRLDELLDRVKGDESARQEFVDLLEVMGNDDPRIPAYRKALTARLF
jgi:putative thioredoxin